MYVALLNDEVPSVFCGGCSYGTLHKCRVENELDCSLVDGLNEPSRDYQNSSTGKASDSSDVSLCLRLDGLSTPSRNFRNARAMGVGQLVSFAAGCRSTAQLP